MLRIELIMNPLIFWVHPFGELGDSEVLIEWGDEWRRTMSSRMAGIVGDADCGMTA